MVEAASGGEKQDARELKHKILLELFKSQIYNKCFSFFSAAPVWKNHTLNTTLSYNHSFIAHLLRNSSLCSHPAVTKQHKSTFGTF